ncbi:MAG TPA: RMD1 family protein [Spirochaetota bacterium]|nr:RMD1 family protein [Spirochaetota bacterium]HPI87673.1 RMD1 family protein [Spirochaetota bacterium]HPR49714.1 RMD1 family protein [Spirochaetota bacterium]
MKCIAYCLAKTFNFAELIDYLTENERTALYRDTLHIMKDDGNIMVFPYGVVIAWGISHDDTKRLFDQIQPYCEGLHDKPFVDEFSFSMGHESVKIHADQIHLTEGEPLEIISLSHGIAQSVKLSELEQYVQETIDSTSHIPQSIAKSGRTNMNRKEIARLRGGLFLVEADINMNFELLDTPEFFWEFPEFEEIYYAVTKYLDTKSRIELLIKKLAVIHNLLIMLADEQNHKHMAILEWIIIWLIAFEIIIFFYKDIISVLIH